MIISQTTNVDFIVRCVMSSWDMLIDDGAGSKDLYFPPITDDAKWYKVDDFGVFLMTRQNFATFEVHTCLLPHARGVAVEVAKAALAWAWDNTEAQRIVTSVPSYNPLALRLAKKAGMTVYGVNPKSFSRHGILYDMTLLGISRR